MSKSWYRSKSIKREKVLALFGAHDLIKPSEPARISLPPKEITLHENWNPRTEEYYGDVSLLEFEKGSIVFSDFIQPICLWGAEKELILTEGVVASWERSEQADIRKNVPARIRVSIISERECISSHPDLYSNTTFCADMNVNWEVCTGNGLFIKFEGVYYLKGIYLTPMIRYFTSEITGEEKLSQKDIFSDVMKLKEWIESKSALKQNSTIFHSN